MIVPRLVRVLLLPALVTPMADCASIVPAFQKVAPVAVGPKKNAPWVELASVVMTRPPSPTETVALTP